VSDTITDDGDKGVPVIKTEWGHSVASPADFDCFGESQFPCVIFVPEGFGFFVTLRSGFVQGVSALTKSRVHGDDKFPVAIFEPGSFHPWRADFFLAAAISWTVLLWELPLPVVL